MDGGGKTAKQRGILQTKRELNNKKRTHKPNKQGSRKKKEGSRTEESYEIEIRRKFNDPQVIRTMISVMKEIAKKYPITGRGLNAEANEGQTINHEGSKKIEKLIGAYSRFCEGTWTTECKKNPFNTRDFMTNIANIEGDAYEYMNNLYNQQTQSNKQKPEVNIEKQLEDQLKTKSKIQADLEKNTELLNKLQNETMHRENEKNQLKIEIDKLSENLVNIQERIRVYKKERPRPGKTLPNVLGMSQLKKMEKLRDVLLKDIKTKKTRYTGLESKNIHNLKNQKKIETENKKLQSQLNTILKQLSHTKQMTPTKQTKQTANKQTFSNLFTELDYNDLEKKSKNKTMVDINKQLENSCNSLLELYAYIGTREISNKFNVKYWNKFPQKMDYKNKNEQKYYFTTMIYNFNSFFGDIIRKLMKTEKKQINFKTHCKELSKNLQTLKFNSDFVKQLNNILQNAINPPNQDKKIRDKNFIMATFIQLYRDLYKIYAILYETLCSSSNQNNKEYKIVQSDIPKLEQIAHRLRFIRSIMNHIGNKTLLPPLDSFVNPDYNFGFSKSFMDRYNEIVKQYPLIDGTIEEQKERQYIADIKVLKKYYDQNVNNFVIPLGENAKREIEVKKVDDALNRLYKNTTISQDEMLKELGYDPDEINTKIIKEYYNDQGLAKKFPKNAFNAKMLKNAVKRHNLRITK
jgi:hypothetical protein